MAETSMWGSSLPMEAMLQIFAYLDAKTLCICSKVNHYWNSASAVDPLWKNLCNITYLEQTKTHSTFKEAYQQYVERNSKSYILVWKSNGEDITTLAFDKLGIISRGG